jgi:hypothetical protein
LDLLKGFATDPKSNFLFITDSELVDVVYLDHKLLADINAYYEKEYQSKGDFVEIKLQNTSIKIVGFKCEEVLEKLKVLLREIKDYDFPKNWNNIPGLVQGE